jgi:competence protein ComEA
MEEKTLRLIGLVLLGSVLLAAAAFAMGYRTGRGAAASEPIAFSTPLPTATPLPSPTPAPIRVYVSGAVRSPSVCELPVGATVEDAVGAAGGPTADADLACINLALELQDQQHVHVPKEGEADPPPVLSGGGSEQGGTGPININTATADELETLPGVGEVTAQRIVAYREENGPFESIEEIQEVAGIGAKTFEGMRDLIAVGS